MNRIWWLGVPLGFIFLQILLEIFLSPQTLTRMHSENGTHELLQFIAIAIAFIVAVITFLKMDKRRYKWPACWVALAALCSFYVAGEEVSWGQHFLDWSTPEFWAAVNDQQETNLHNTSSWLDQKPRLLLEIGVLTGGLILPLLQKYRPALVPQRFNLIYPPKELMLVALLALGVKLAEKIAEIFGVALFERASEVEELYLFYFVMLYLFTLRKRLT